MSASTQPAFRPRPKWVASISLAAAVALGLAACGGDDSSSTAATASATSTASASAPGTSFSTANVSGLGDVVVDGNGRTVYVLTSDGQKNVPCDDGSGCTKAWPDLPLPDGVAAAKAGTGIQASLLATMKAADGETYPTYNGWLMYEFAGDKGPGQGKGQGITSFGGTWYALTPAGTPITTAAPPTTRASTGGGY